MGWRVLEGDALTTLRTLEAGIVQTCVTSPPYFGLRDYGHEGQIGLEATPDEYVAALVEVFREVRRVLRDDGTLWLNLGDSYAVRAQAHTKDPTGFQSTQSLAAYNKDVPPGMKPKDLLGIPWMVAFALRADGWYLRSDIIWSKPNPMPESVTDRPTKAHEYLFLLSKSPRYFYDADAVREDASSHLRQNSFRDDWGPKAEQIDRTWHGPPKDRYDEPNRNKRSVWTVATTPFRNAHFAVFPPKLIEPCILAGSSEQACGVCGAPWRRVVERMPVPAAVGKTDGAYSQDGNGVPRTSRGIGKSRQYYREQGLEGPPPPRTVGFEPSCDHAGGGLTKGQSMVREYANAERGIGSSVVLDPFAGAGTTGLVATRHGRGFVGIELNPEYAELARERIRDDAPLMNYLSEAA